jgi:biopolymer transport protein ExbD
VNSSGTIKFRGETMSPAEFEPKLKQVVKATPDQDFVIEARKDVPKEKFEAVLDICAAVGTKNLTMSILPSDSEPDKTPVPEVASPKALPVTESPKAKPVTEPAKAQGPLTVQVHINGSIGFKGVTITLLEFQTKLKALIKTTPDQELVIKSGAKVPYDKLKAVLDSCADAQVRHVTVASPSPTPPSVPESPAVNLPAPTLLMRPSMETMSSNAPPIAPTAPPPSGP